MITATIVFFLAIFGGVLFLALLIWFIFRRRGNSSSQNQFISSGASPGIYHDYSDNEIVETDSDQTAFVNDNFTSSEEKTASEVTAYDSSRTAENSKSHTSQSDYSAPAAPTYSESTSSSYDSGGASSDSASSSSDSGSSSSSSD